MQVPSNCVLLEIMIQLELSFTAFSVNISSLAIIF